MICTDFTKDERNYLKDHIASGNDKLPSTTAIFNFGSAKDCPSKALGLCEVAKQCYAMKAEIQYYKAVPAYRNRQLALINSLSAEKFAAMFQDINKAKRKKFTILRINESGDFYTQADVDKMERVAEILANDGVKVYCYSARKDLNFSQCQNMTVNGSNFQGHNQFKAVVKPTGKNVVCPGSCKTCSLCSIKTGKLIEVVIH